LRQKCEKRVERIRLVTLPPYRDLVDPRRRGTPFWFERMERPRPDGGGAITLTDAGGNADGPTAGGRG
jgi:hypothetical protein